ncbi:site-specific DNA-methyltransferase [Aliarcobacter butzleri]|uniref:site-specific DNA-methyltransferase n=1 Tax=Aliarcobacter butzleri TaxID=28197 RepID=UPI0021B2416A|nr:site-specific DNA-methyltransferase [Aliarcobacter butzleri]MCT7583086.1 site-specific DNA-methyltransferase [Aliarcobacter butzleri]
MYLFYSNKKDKDLILFNNSEYKLNKDFVHQSNNLIFGDNIEVLRKLIFECNLKGKIDLVYIDPPFSTNTKFKIGKDRVSTISSSYTDILAYDDTLKGADFLEFLRERLILIKELLSEKGSIYLHIDYKIGHYVKIIMDEVFGIENFRNDITRIKCNPKNFKRKAYGNIKDLILFYSKTDNYIWNDIKEKYLDKDLQKLFSKIDIDGRRYTTIPLHAPGETLNGETSKEWRGLKPPKGRHWRCSPLELEELEQNGLIEWSSKGNPRKKIYADEKEGKKRQDIWEFKDSQKPTYPTEKNLSLLETIIENSSNEDSIIMDCFSGSGSTLEASFNLKRKFIGVDNSIEALKVIETRLKNKKIEFNKLELIVS